MRGDLEAKEDKREIDMEDVRSGQPFPLNLEDPRLA
jgi:hypothetical protein